MALRHRRAVEAPPTADAPAENTSFASVFKRLDVYPKLDEDVKVKTSSGAAVSLVSGVCIFVLFCSELSTYLAVARRDHVLVDYSIGEKLRINLNITFHALTCGEVSLDAMDVAGEEQLGVDHAIFKARVSPTGAEIHTFAHKPGQDDAPPALPDNYCGSCYGAQTDVRKCCNTCGEVKAAYGAKGWGTAQIEAESEQCKREQQFPAAGATAGEGCRVFGTLLVNKVAGNFHVAMGDSAVRNAQHIHQFNPGQLVRYNASHTIHSLSFGEPYPGMINPLDGARGIVSLATGTGVFFYYIKIVPTIYSGGGTIVKTNQFSATEQFRSAVIDGVRQNILPGVFVVYDFSAFMVEVTESREPFFHFITGLCAIIGGVFTVAGILDSVIYRSSKLLKIK